MSHILRLEPASQPQNLRAEPEKLERMTYRSMTDRQMDKTVVAFTMLCSSIVHKNQILTVEL